METEYSEIEIENLLTIAKEILDRVFILKRSFDNSMSTTTAFIYIKNIDLATDFKGIGLILGTTFHNRNDKKIFDYMNSRYYISHRLHKLFNLDFIEYTIEITMEE